MNFKIAALLACIMLAPRSWAMQQAQIKTVPASFATTLAQNPRYLFYASAGFFAGTMLLDIYLDLQRNKSLRKAKNEAEDICRAKFERNEISSPEMHVRIHKMNIEAQKKLRKQYLPLDILTAALGATTGITLLAGCVLKAKNKFSPAMVK